MTYEISEEAMDVAWGAFSESSDEYLDYVTALAYAITAAAPLIVATELRRILTHPATMRRGEVGRAAMFKQLRERADELDPPGGAS